MRTKISKRDAPKIYTKGGDRGQTGILGGARLSKADLRLAAYGSIDELNGQIGLVVAHIGERQAAQPAGQKVKLNGLVEFLTAVQNQLFVLGSHLACADEKMRALLPVLDPEKTVLIETEIDARTDELPELRQFILPGGTVVGATLHVARTICRRAERAIVEFLDAPTTDFPKSHGDAVVTYMNRLGDYLFVAARWANHEADQPETIWQKE